MKQHATAPLLALLLALAFAACRSTGPADAGKELDPAFRELPGSFSQEAAWRHLRHLTEIGPRVSGSLGAAEARGYIERELREAGARLIPASAAQAAEARIDLDVADLRAAAGEQPPSGSVSAPQAASAPSPAPSGPPAGPQPVNLLAEIPGASSDVVLLMAPYDTAAIEGIRFVGANDGASGAALLLELARVLVARPLPYTTWLLFADGEAAGADGQPALRGSTAFAQLLKADGNLSRIRLAVYVNRVGDADLRISRDLISNRVYRNAFWDAAERLGYAEHFQQDAFESTRAGHLPLRAAGLAAVILLQDSSFGGQDPPGAYANSEDDDLEHCAPDSLEVTGRVILEGLDAISTRLAKIDHFANAPLDQLRGESGALREQASQGVAVPPGAGTPARE